jgi:hypothetical protein
MVLAEVAKQAVELAKKRDWVPGRDKANSKTNKKK